MKSSHLSCTISAHPQVVYDFVASADNLSAWATGLAEGDARREGEAVIVKAPMGEVRVHFAPNNEYGVLDHDVTLPSGAVVNNPMRVIAHPAGAEVIFTLRQLDLTDDEFEHDCQMVDRDLATLKSLLETRALSHNR